jgi:hypothetical protein
VVHFLVQIHVCPQKAESTGPRWNPQRASMAPRVAGMVTWRPYASVSIGRAVPGWPIRSLVAEDRSAGGVRDRAGQ